MTTDLVVRDIGLLPRWRAPRRGRSRAGRGARDRARGPRRAGGRIVYAGPSSLRPADFRPAPRPRRGRGGVCPASWTPTPTSRSRATATTRSGGASPARATRDRRRGRRHRQKRRGHARRRRAKTLRDACASRLDEMLLCGTTTAEVKSGYGLETAAELRSLEAIRAAAARHRSTVVPTFLGAHEVPLEHRDRPRALRRAAGRAR